MLFYTWHFWSNLKAGLKKQSSMVAVLPGRQLKCSNFPGRKKEKRNGRKGKDRNKGTERKKEKGQNGAVCRERRTKCVREMKVIGLLPGRKKFLEPSLKDTDSFSF